jgi:hypothetical protein
MHPDWMQFSKHEQNRIIDSVTVLLNQLNPNGVEPGVHSGASWDEYVSEAHPMASLLINKGSVTTDQIDAIWQKWFSEPLSVVASLARRVRSSSRLASTRLSSQRSSRELTVMIPFRFPET